ncbi:RYamide receptor-like [Oculina patagonica]
MSLRNYTTIPAIGNETSLGQENSTCISVDSTAWKISKLSAYCLVLLGSFLGNTFIIIIVYKHRDLRKTVNCFIVNMAVSDLVFPLIVLPVNITELVTDSKHWRVRGILGTILCKFLYFGSLVSLFVSTQSLVWIAIDRFVAIVFPIKLGIISTRIRTIAIVFTWTFAGLLSSPSLISTGLVMSGNETFCADAGIGIVHINPELIEAYAWVQITFVFIAPMFIITVMYTTIAVVLRRQNKALAETTPNAQRNSSKKRRKAIEVAVVVVVLFYICVIPQTLLHFFYYWRPSCSFYRVFYFLAQISIMLSSTVNPIICLTFVESYRRALRSIAFFCGGGLRNNKRTKREQITSKGMQKSSGENCQEASKGRENVQETLDTAL